ncbi:hypothetical protein D9Q98_001671 [Chlorella vulgaris]|uniref:Reverse transcriptase domain-containing protein n=1 Tax=Chlorella vulgaris TaxID=3077 RepID=A0A9D4TUV0_CHLVU|nr:hypothetical protein D9Q98_001671 [Chlorella vulgaris]
MAASPSLLSQAAELQVLPEIPEYRGHRALSLELVPSPAPQRSTAKHADPESEGFGPPPTFAAPLRLTPDRLLSFAAELKQPAKAEQLRRLTEEASRDPLLAATQLHAILYGTAAAVFPPTNAAPRQAAGSTSGQLRRRHQPWFDEECAATRRQIRLQMQASLNSGQPSHLAKEALRIISNRYTRLRKRKAGAWQRQQGSSLLHMQRTDARKFFKQWQREHPKSPIDAATWLRHFVNLQLKRTFQPTASLTATSNPATSHPTAAIPSCSPPTATVCPSSSHPTTAVPATSNPTTSHPTAAISSCSPSAATVPSSSQPTTDPPAINPATCHSTPLSTASSELDTDISVADVHAALDKLSSSSACLGPLKAVLIKAGRDALTPVLAALFNAVFRSGCFPPEWSLGAITPIHKKGDTADPNNYRGITAIQAMYADVPVCVRTEEGLSGCFQSVLGVKQGCPLSPLLFGIFLDDFEGHIQQLGDAAALPQLAGRTVPPLLFADDMFLLSSSASGLQAQLHALQDYCNAKKLTVNAKKTQVMIMRPGGGSGNGKLAAGESFEYAGLPLEVASSTKYLGLTFSQLSKQHGFASCADVLAKAGRQAMFAMRRRAWELGACLVEQQCMLFDVFVKPVLSYGCELWGVDVLLRPDCSSVERVHRWFCRRVQGLPKQVTAAISLAELGRQPLQSFWIQQLVRFWNRLQNSAADEDRVLGWAFKDNLELMREGGDLAAGSACWSRRWLHVLQSAPPASGTLEWLTELDEAAVIERAAAAYLRKRVQGLPKQVTAAISLAELGRQPLQSFWIQQLVRFWNRLQNSAADEDRVLGWAFKDNLELMREGGDLAAGSACWSRRWLHLHAILYGTAAAVFPPTNAAPRQAAGSTSGQLRRRHQPWFDEECAATRRQIRLQMQASLNSGQPSHLAKEALRIISNRYTRLRKRKAGAWQRQQGSSLLHMQRTDARKFFKQWQREHPKSPIDAATWLRHFVNLQLKRTFPLTATSNPATSHPTAAIPSCSPPTATVCPSSSHPTTAVPATSNPTTSHPTAAISSCSPSAATVPSSSQPTTDPPAINPATCHSTPLSTASSELDTDISVADVHAALDKLSSSSACLGPLKAVLIKAGRDALTPVLAALFNAVFRSGCFPPEWSLGAITPIHKKGDTADPNNYRGITVGHILGKLYALAINTRLNTWLETQGLRARGQAGFRQGYRTVDNCFILRALAERARSRGVKLYLCAVDFEKAFDSVDRPLLWAALQRAGIGGTMLQAIQAMYADVPVCVRTEEGLSGCFQSVLGVKQGCPLSPLLFGIFLDDFEGHIQQLGDAAALPQLAGRTVPPLLFADDMFLLSSSASGLQAQLHALQDYCNAKKLTVNAKKTQVMIMRPGGGSGNGKLAAGESFEYAGLPLEVASSTKYLGLTFSQLSKQHGFASCADVLAKAGRQAMFAMRRRAWELGACLVEQQCMLFDVFVKPVLSYGCELWGVDVLLRPDCSSVERVHRWFCRRVQGLPKQVTAAISLAELGRQPLQSFWIQQLVRFWNRLQNSAADEDRVLGHPRMAH